MMKLKPIEVFKKYMFVGTFVVFALALCSCETKIDFLVSSIVPAARGYATIKTDKNENYVIHIRVSSLAESTRLTPPKATYVLWIVGVNNEAQNIGQLQTSNLKASLETVSPFKPSKIFITAEDAGNVRYPSQTILTTPDF